MNILTNICNPKEQHFQQQARTQAYKPLNEYVFQNRTMERMRARFEPIQNPEEYKYKSWNHPYSISNYFMTQKGTVNVQNKQSMGGNADYVSYQNDSMIHNSQDRNGNKKISFKEIPQALCGIGKEQQQGEKLFSNRQDFYTSLKSNDQTYGRSAFVYQPRKYGPEQNDVFNRQGTRFSRSQNLQNNPGLSQNSHSFVVLSQEILKLKMQNKELKRIIEQEYKPMKVLYNKLLSQQEEREYLISKLEWKVRQLVKEMGAASNSFGTGMVIQPEQNHNFDTKKETKNLSRVDSQKHFGQTSTQQQNFKAFETNFSNIKIPQSKPHAYNNFQSPYKNTNINNVNQEKSYGQFSYASPSVNNAYQRVSTQQNNQQPFQNPHLATQYPFQNQNLLNIQQNNYVSAGTGHHSQVTSHPIQNNNMGQNYQKSLQNYQLNSSSSQVPYQNHYQVINQRYNS